MRSARACVIALMWFGAAVSVTAQQTAGSVLALTGGTVIDGTGAPPEPNMTVLVEGARIRDVFRTGAKPLPAGATIRDLRGQFVIPGLIDAHVHVGPNAATNGALARLLRGGVTSVRNMVGNCAVLREFHRRASTGEIESPDVYFSSVAAGPASSTDTRRPREGAAVPPGPGCNHPLASEAFDAAQLVAAAKATGATGFKLYADFSADAARRLTEESHRQGLATWAHATIFPARPSDLVRVGVQVLSHAAYLVWEPVDSLPDYHRRVLQAPFTRIAATDPAIERLLKSMAERGTILDATLHLFENLAAAPDSPNPDMGTDPVRFAAAAKFAGDVTRRARELGVLVAAGTDGMLPPDSTGLPNIHGELEYLVTRSGFTPVQAIASATSIAARTMNLEKTIGTIAAGAQADLVVLRSDPSANIRNTRDIVFVVKRGRIVDAVRKE